MIYILLIIIAVGVLLASQAGKTLLGWLIGLIVIGLLFYALFWIIVLIYALGNSPDGHSFIDGIGYIFGTTFALLIAIALSYGDYKFFVSIWKNRKKIFGRRKNNPDKIGIKQYLVKNSWGLGVVLFTLIFILGLIGILSGTS